jgi:hypothetical protein
MSVAAQAECQWSSLWRPTTYGARRLQRLDSAPDMVAGGTDSAGIDEIAAETEWLVVPSRSTP